MSETSYGLCSNNIIIRVTSYITHGIVLQDTNILVTDATTYLSGASYAIFKALNGTNVTIGDLEESPVLRAKAIKNAVEKDGMIEAHIKDAIAVCKFASYLEKEIHFDKHWTELSAAELLTKYRSQQLYNKGISFHPISAFGSNGAIIHYTPSASTDKNITKNSLFMSKFIYGSNVAIIQCYYMNKNNK